jgi:hypothetical protein
MGWGESEPAYTGHATHGRARSQEARNDSCEVSGLGDHVGKGTTQKITKIKNTQNKSNLDRPEQNKTQHNTKKNTQKTKKKKIKNETNQNKAKQIKQSKAQPSKAIQSNMEVLGWVSWLQGETCTASWVAAEATSRKTWPSNWSCGLSFLPSHTCTTRLGPFNTWPDSTWLVNATAFSILATEELPLLFCL